VGWALTHYDYDFIAAERAYERSIELNPRYATAHQWFGLLLAPLNRLDESFTEFKRAIRLDPLSLIIHAAFAWAYYLARFYEDSVEECKKMLELDVNFFPAWYALGAPTMFRGDEEQAISAFQKGVELSSRAGAYLSGLGWAFAKVGRRQQALDILDELFANMEQGKYVMPPQIAIIYAELQEKEKALNWLEKGFAERSPWMVYLNSDPRYDGLRSEPRFCDLVRRMNLTRTVLQAQAVPTRDTSKNT
jgi:tetratricopeptide (TPR) repeat protein